MKPLIILYQPRDVRNIGAVVRAMKNTGHTRLRLVTPPPFDPADLTGIAHRSEDVLEQMEILDSLDAALADCAYVVGTTARHRTVRPLRSDIRTLAAELRHRAAHEPVALVFGPEDNGLDNAALDRCHEVLTLPLDPAYPSLNLAQAVLLVCYELWMSEPQQQAAPETERASAGQLATLFAEAEQALHTIAFFKGSPVPILRTLRQLANRAAPSPAEAMLLTAIAREVQRFVARRNAADPS